MFAIRSLAGSSLGFSWCLNAFQQSGKNFSALASKADVYLKMNIPEKPKKPLSPFMIYLNSHREELKRENPNVSIADLGRLAGQKWKTEDPTVKEKLQKEYSSRMYDYTNSIMKYESQLTDEQKKAIKKVMSEAREEKKQRKIKREVKLMGKPKKPPSNFFLFMKDFCNQQNQPISKETFKLAGEKWALLSEEKKATYKAEFEENIKKYHKDLMKWEAEMIQKGRQDLIRDKSRLDVNQEKKEHHRKPKETMKENKLKYKSHKE